MTAKLEHALLVKARVAKAYVAFISSWITWGQQYSHHASSLCQLVQVKGTFTQSTSKIPSFALCVCVGICFARRWARITFRAALRSLILTWWSVPGEEA